jgi:hypothetical protein
MLARLARKLTYANVVATLALIIAVGGTTAYAANTINSTDIVDGQVKSVDVGDNEVKSADVKDESLTTFDVSTFLGADVVDGTLTGDDIKDGSINDKDLALSRALVLPVQVGVVFAQTCKNVDVPIDAGPDHIVLTPAYYNTTTNLSYTAEWGTFKPVLKVCNPTSANIDDRETDINVLVIDGTGP